MNLYLVVIGELVDFWIHIVTPHWFFFSLLLLLLTYFPQILDLTRKDCTAPFFHSVKLFRSCERLDCLANRLRGSVCTKYLVYMEKGFRLAIFLVNSKAGKEKLRIEKKPKTRKINTSDCLGEKMCLLFQQTEDLFAFFKVTSKCSSWNYVRWKTTKFFVNVQFKLLQFFTVHLFPLLQHIRHTSNNFR